MSKNIAVSKFLSYVLRHEPQSIGIALDRDGWTDIDTLIKVAKQSGNVLDRDIILAVVADNDKKRFTISPDGQRIRAAQGHSTDQVDLNYTEQVPPEYLYHGTATRFIESIRKEGLRPGQRHYVHLSADEKTAIAVGRRHGKPVVLKIASLRMHKEGFKFFQADNGVWLTEKVPTEFFNSST